MKNYALLKLILMLHKYKMQLWWNLLQLIILNSDWRHYSKYNPRNQKTPNILHSLKIPELKAN